MAAHELQSIELANGLHLQYVEQGEPTGVPVLLLPGFIDSWRSFEPVLSHLPAQVRPFAITQRGHGDADRPAAGYGPRDFAADAVGFLDALDLPRALVVGHSMSAIVAQRIAIDHPERILGLVLVGWRGYPRPSVAAALVAMEDPDAPDFVREFQKASLAQPVPDAFFEAMVQESLKVPARVWRAVIHDFRADQFLAELGSIRTPTWIVWGDQDATCPRSEQEALAGTITGARLVVYPGCGHCLHWEEPARFAADLVAIIDEVRASST